jgi:hypothetical protein
VYDTFAQCPNPAPERFVAAPICSVCGLITCGPAAELRSPGDCYHPEGYLIKWLVRLYGWRVIEPGVLRRVRRPEQSLRQIQPQARPLAPVADAISQEVAA